MSKRVKIRCQIKASRSEIKIRYKKMHEIKKKKKNARLSTERPLANSVDELLRLSICTHNSFTLYPS